MEQSDGNASALIESLTRGFVEVSTIHPVKSLSPTKAATLNEPCRRGAVCMRPALRTRQAQAVRRYSGGGIVK